VARAAGLVHPKAATTWPPAAADPWLQDGMLSIVSIERWTILLDGLTSRIR
jgi:hypothetical protein